MRDWYDADMSPDEFRRLGHHAIDMIADYYATVRDVPVYPNKRAQDIARVFDEDLPESPQEPEEILDSWRDRIVPNATHLGSPRYFGFVNGSGSMIATLAEALGAAVNMNSGGWKASPAGTEIERRTIRWLAEAIGYNPDCGGLLTSGGMMANFTGLTAALRNISPYDMLDNGVQAPERKGRFRLYISDHEGHVSIPASTDLMGIGRSSVIPVASRPDFSMDVGALRSAIEEDLGAGEIPFCVVGQAGSINVGVIDPLPQIADICKEYGLWFHADGACGALGAMIPEKAHLYDGLERADSITMDPHKWLYIPYECGAVLVKDAERLRRSFSMTAPYLRSTIPSDYDGLNYYEYGPQMSRGFRALKLWMTMKHYGVSGYRRLMSQNILCAQRLHELAQQSPNFETLHEPELFIYSVRFAPREWQKTERDGDTEQRLDRINQMICDRMQLSGEAFLMTTRIHGRVVVRFSVCSHRTMLEDIERVFSRIEAIGLELAASADV